MASASKPLRIFHVFRSPVGGIFRHVRDLVGEHVSQGHSVGIICDSNTGGEFEEALFRQLQPKLALGLQRFKMKRSLGLGDVLAARQVQAILREARPDIVHSHGAKGGAYARLASDKLRKQGQVFATLYTPHGGTIHFDAGRFKSRAYFSLERFLQRWTDRLIFVSAYERNAYFKKVGQAPCPHSLIYNGLAKDEFVPIVPQVGAADFVYIGMMRDLKGVDLFLAALQKLSSLIQQDVSAVLVGDGPDLERYRQQASNLSEKISITFHPPMPCRETFALGRCVVVPSRAESMPYMVLETLAAQKPLIATRVGGIPEIYGVHQSTLVEPDNVEALTHKMSDWLSGLEVLPEATTMASHIADQFSISTMASDVLKAYYDSLATAS